MRNLLDKEGNVLPDVLDFIEKLKNDNDETEERRNFFTKILSKLKK
jgi:hypothetical protein